MLPSRRRLAPLPGDVERGYLIKLTHVVAQADDERDDAQAPEDDAEGLGHAALEVGGLVLEVEGERDGHGEDGQVDGDAEVREEGCARSGRPRLAWTQGDR